MNIKQEAQNIYDQTRPTADQIRVFGVESLRPIQKATLEQIEAHIQNCEDAAKFFGLSYLDYKKIEFGKSRDEIFAIAESRRKINNRHAGTRALVNKYGKQTAQKIIHNKTGKYISLKG